LLPEARGLFEPYAPAGLERVNARFRDPASPPSWVGIDVFMSALCVNTAELETRGLPVPTSLDDLADPQYQGLVITPNPQFSGSGFIALSALAQRLGEGPAFVYTDALDVNVPFYTRSGTRPCQLAAEGTYPIGLSFDTRAVAANDDGAPVAAVFPAEGSGWDVEANALVEKPDIQPAARRFLDWAISDGAMREYARYQAITSVPTGLPVPEGYPADPLAQLIENDLVWAATDRDRLVMKWTERYGQKTEGTPAPTPGSPHTTRAASNDNGPVNRPAS
jgi:iron(III) transport system substrate-binding protein